jgi:hypothetical protein
MELKLMRVLTRRQSNQSKKVEVVRYCYQWQILKLIGKRKVKKDLTVPIKTPNKTEEETTLECYRNTHLSGSVR